MEGSTLLGRRCPQCGSFVKEGLDKCPVCGYEFPAETSLSVSVEEGIRHKKLSNIGGKGIKCPKCGKENPPEASFCKFCGFPLMPAQQQIEEVRSYETEEKSSMKIEFEWQSSNYDNLEGNVLLKKCEPFFAGVGAFEGFAFMVYNSTLYPKVMIRKISSQTEGKLFVKYNKGLIVLSGTEFYLGAVGFQLLGSAEHKDMMQETNEIKTVMAGPGEDVFNIFTTGKPRIRVLNMPGKNDILTVNWEFILGRETLMELLQIEELILAQSGVSKHHLKVQPLTNGSWYLVPLSGKSFYVEIKEDPVILDNNTIIRIVKKNGVPVEAKLHIKTIQEE